MDAEDQLSEGKMKIHQDNKNRPHPPPCFRSSDFGEGGSDRVGRLRTPKSAVSRAKTPRYPKITGKTSLLGGRARRRRKILGFWGPPKCDSLRGKRSKRGPKSEKKPSTDPPPPLVFEPIGREGGGGSVLNVLIYLEKKNTAPHT